MLWTAYCLSIFLMPAAPSPAGVTIVAVVKVPEVSEQYKKTKDLEGQFEQLRAAFNKEREERKSRIDRAARSLQEELKPGTDAYRDRRREIAVMEAEFQAFVEYEGEKLEQGLARSLRTIYDDIQKAVADVAAEKGIDIVLATDEMPAEAANTTQQVRQQIVLQKVLFWNPRVDITADVIEKANAKYAAQKSGEAANSSAKPAKTP